MGQGLVERFDDEANRASHVTAVLELGYGLIVEIKGEIGTVGNDTQRVFLTGKPHDGIAASFLENAQAAGSGFEDLPALGAR